jgi:hypothetical protein
MIPEEKILAMGCLDVSPVFPGFFDGPDCRMLIITEEDIKFPENVE